MKLDNKKNGVLLGEYAAFLALVLLATVLGAISPEFRQISNLLNLLCQAAFNGLIAIGMTLVILSDGIDPSVGSVFALATIICAKLVGVNTVKIKMSVYAISGFLAALAGLCEGLPIPQVLKMSAKASSIAVSRPGAVPSIPWRSEVEQALAE